MKNTIFQILGKDIQNDKKSVTCHKCLRSTNDVLILAPEFIPRFNVKDRVPWSVLAQGRVVFLTVSRLTHFLVSLTE